MKLLLIGHDDRYCVEQLQLSLFPLAAMECVSAPFSGDGAVSCLHRGKTYLTAVTTITQNGKKTRGVRRLRADRETVPLRRRILQQSYYLAALPHLPKAPDWGALAGVRPTKLTTAYLLAGGTPAGADRLLRDVYYVTPARRSLALRCSASSCAAVKLLAPGDLSVYIGIPFCPSRCVYCSFVSRTVGQHASLLAPYLDALEKEIALTGKLLASSGCRVRTLYIGGGTPTTLTSTQLARLMDAVAAAFDLSGCLEYTVEAGRPDTLDAEKLRTIRAHGANRISINPQSMDDAVLAACHRPHTAQAVLRAYREALDAGFADINMDLIAGLPKDTPETFARSLDTIAALAPSNITVHTLALKKGADLFENRASLPSAEAVAAMLAHASETLGSRYRPYYLYRQKYMSGSFENVGYSRDGRDCLYNIYMMEELSTIVSLGGGAMSKLKMPDGTLRRFHNPKFPEQYIAQFDSVLSQKTALFEQMKGTV